MSARLGANMIVAYGKVLSGEHNLVFHAFDGLFCSRELHVIGKSRERIGLAHYFQEFLDLLVLAHFLANQTTLAITTLTMVSSNQLTFMTLRRSAASLNRDPTDSA